MLNLFESFNSNDLDVIELTSSFAKRHVLEQKTHDYKTGAILHRLANRDMDSRTKVLLKRQKLLNRVKQDRDKANKPNMSDCEISEMDEGDATRYADRMRLESPDRTTAMGAEHLGSEMSGKEDQLILVSQMF